MGKSEGVVFKPMGLTKRGNGIWHIDKIINGVRINRSAKTKNLAEAVKLLDRLSDGYKDTFASQEWVIQVDAQFADRQSWANRTLARINKPSVVASKGRPDLNASALRALMLRCDGRCEISSIPFSLERVGQSKTPPFGMSLDRKDSSIGYTMDNCRIVCLSVNLAMREWGESVMVKIGKAMLLRELERDILK
jgi:hypothetical protein